MMRIALFLATNLAVLLLVSVVFNLLGLQGILAQNGVDLNLGSLLTFCALFGFGGAFVSLFLSKWMAKRGTGTYVIEQPRNRDEQWLVDTVGTEECKIVELQGTVGSTPAINRKQGFEEAIAGHDNLSIIRSQTGDFTRSKGKEVMEGFIKAENGGADICAVYAHNDDMAVGAIQAIKDAGLKPGTDILVVSIDAVPDIFTAIAAGEANATVELTPNMAGPASDALAAYWADGTEPEKFIITESKLYTAADDPQGEYDRRKDLGY